MLLSLLFRFFPPLIFSFFVFFSSCLHGRFSSNQVVSSSSNLALKRPTAQSSSGWGSTDGRRAVDGNSNSRYNQRSCTHTRRDSGAWLRVDLGRVADVKTIKLWNRKDCCSDRIKKTKIYVGTTNILADATECGDVNDVKKNPIVIQCASSINGRYVWVKKTDRNYLTVCELEVFSAKTSAIAAAPLQSNPFIYVKGVQLANSAATNYCGLSRHKNEGIPASILFGNQFPALFDCSGQADAVQIGEEIASTSELYYDDRNEDGSVKTEGWRAGAGAGSVLDTSLNTMTYGTTATAVTSCAGQAASCRQMHGPFAQDTAVEISKEWKNMPKHTALRVKARVWSVGSWDKENVIIETSNKALSEVKVAYSYVGCYQDHGNRDLSGKYHGRGHDQKSCSAKCRSSKYFALQDYKNRGGAQCFCGEKYGKYKTRNRWKGVTLGAYPHQQCKCSQNGGGICGGAGWRNAVYRQYSNAVQARVVENYKNQRHWQKHRSNSESLWVKMTDPIYNPWSNGRGGAYYDHVDFVIPHTSSEFSLIVRTSINQKANDEYFGLSDVQIFLESTETDVMYCGYAIEHKEATDISCPDGGSISSVVFASYGTPTSRPTGTKTSTCTTKKYTTSACHASKSKKEMEMACVGKKRCTLSAVNKIFGDPCRGTYKWLQVQYKCAPSTKIPALQEIVEETKPKTLARGEKPSSCPSDVPNNFVACMNVPENSRSETQVGVLMASTAPGQLSYSLLSNSQGLFTIDNNGGAISLSPGGGSLDFETLERHEIVVRVQDTSSNLFSDAQILISVTDVNEAPVFGITAGREIDENALAGSFVGEALAVTDVDNGDKLTYALSGGSGIHRFNISQTGRLAVNGNGTLNHEVDPVFIVHVKVTG